MDVVAWCGRALARGLGLAFLAGAGDGNAAAPDPVAPRTVGVLAVDARDGRATLRIDAGAVEVLGRWESDRTGRLMLRAVGPDYADIEALDPATGRRAIYRVRRGEKTTLRALAPEAPARGAVAVPIREPHQ